MPRPQRVELGDRKPGDIVAVGAVGVVILHLRRLGDAGEDLERDVAVFEAGQVDMAAASAGQKVALPQQGVAVQINDGQGAMQRAGLFADLRQRAARDLVHAALDRKSVVWGKSVSVRGDLGGRRIIKKKNTIHNKSSDYTKKN